MFPGVHGAPDPGVQVGGLVRPLLSVVDPVLEKVVVPELSVAVTDSAVVEAQSLDEPSQKSRSACIASAMLDAFSATSARTRDVPVLETRSAPSLAQPSRPTLMTISATITSTRLKPRARCGRIALLFIGTSNRWSGSERTSCLRSRYPGSACSSGCCWSHAALPSVRRRRDSERNRPG